MLLDIFFWLNNISMAGTRHCWGRGSVLPCQWQLAGYAVPLIHGFVSYTGHYVVGGQRLDYILISRKARTRAGARFTRRGIDRNGHVANFIETEQMVRKRLYLCSPASHRAHLVCLSSDA